MKDGGGPGRRGAERRRFGAHGGVAVGSVSGAGSVSRQHHAVLGPAATAGHRRGPVAAAAEHDAAVRGGRGVPRLRAGVGGVRARPGPDPRPPRVPARVRGLHGVHAPHQAGSAVEKDPGAEGQDDQGGEVHPARVPQG